MKTPANPFKSALKQGKPQIGIRSQLCKIQKHGAAVSVDGSFGHSVGLGLAPTWIEGSLEIAEGIDRPLRPGMILHSPISLRIAGKTGVAFSETWLVTETGREVLTKGKPELTVQRT